MSIFNAYNVFLFPIIKCIFRCLCGTDSTSTFAGEMGTLGKLSEIYGNIDNKNM